MATTEVEDMIVEDISKVTSTNHASHPFLQLLNELFLQFFGNHGIRHGHEGISTEMSTHSQSETPSDRFLATTEEEMGMEDFSKYRVSTPNQTI